MRLEDEIDEKRRTRFMVSGPLVLDQEDQRSWLDGELLPLGPKAFALLGALMKRPQTLVTKDDLFAAGWPDQIVSDAVLTTTIKEIRRALDDPARDPRWIATQHGKGYRFLGPVDLRGSHPGREDLTRRDTQSPPSRRFKSIIALAVLVLAVLAVSFALRPQSDGGDALAGTAMDQRSIVAILPFEAQGPEQWVADAFVGQIDSVLEQTEDVYVTDAGSKGRFEPGARGIDDVRDAGIPRALTGRVSEAGGKLQAHLRLVDTKSGRAIWEDRFEGSREDLLPMLQTAAIAVARSLNTLSSRDELEAMTELGTTSILALEEFEKGMRILEELSSNGSRERAAIAFAHLEKALDHDPSFARAAYALASWNWALLGTPLADPSLDIEEAYARHMSLLDVAIVNTANDTDRLLYRSAKALASLSLKEEVALLEDYLELRPYDVDATAELAAAYARVGAWDDVGKSLDRLATLEMARGQTPLSSAYLFPYDRTRAAEWAARLAAPNTSDYEKSFAVDLYLAAGDKERGLEVMDKVDRSAVTPVRDLIFTLQRLCSTGKYDEGRALALEALSKANWLDGSVLGVVVIGAPDYDVSKVLPSDETAAGRAVIAQFLFTPWFDASRFPTLDAMLKQQGIDRGAREQAIFSCPVG